MNGFSVEPGERTAVTMSMAPKHVARSPATGVKPKSFPPVSELLKNFTDNGGQIGVCPPCGKTHGVTDENLVDNGTWIGAAAMLAAAQERQVHTF